MRTDPEHAALILASLEAAAARAGDLTGAVYTRLFARHPELEKLFQRDTDGAIKGEMLARVFDAILDFIDQRHYAHRLIQCEVITHEEIAVPREVFATFFEIVAQTVREACGPDWTGAMDGAWRGMLADLGYYVTHPDQYAT